MTYKDYRTHLLTCEYLNKEPTGQYKKLHDFLNDLWEDMEFAVNSSNYKFIIQKRNEWYFEQDHNTDTLWCHDQRVCDFFQKTSPTELSNTLEFIQNSFEEHLQCGTGTPNTFPFGKYLRVEEHLKCKVGTPIPKYRTS